MNVPDSLAALKGHLIKNETPQLFYHAMFQSQQSALHLTFTRVYQSAALLPVVCHLHWPAAAGMHDSPCSTRPGCSTQWTPLCPPPSAHSRPRAHHWQMHWPCTQAQALSQHVSAASKRCTSSVIHQHGVTDQGWKLVISRPNARLRHGNASEQR